jgi:CDP-diacylglycerol--glycerol-3-phosphate 3-phosphatidyltransferase
MANAITVIRLLLVPIIFGLLAWQNAGADKAAFFLFALAALSDLVDGQIARRYSGVTEFGRIVDPFADRALILAGLLGLLVHGAIPAWAFVALLCRDFVMVFGYCLGKALKKPLVPVNKFGRATNFYLMASIVILLFKVAFLESEIFTWFFDLGVILYITSGLVYIVLEIALLNNQRKEQTV